jgi:hypothetical protein
VKWLPSHKIRLSTIGRAPLGKFFAGSLVFHAVLACCFSFPQLIRIKRNRGAARAAQFLSGVVGSVPGIPMPRPELASPNRVVDESKGLYKSEPPPKMFEKQPDATPIPKFDRLKAPKYVTRPSKVLENKAPPPPNAVPYGGGGTPTVPLHVIRHGHRNGHASRHGI